jgi:chemotaxis protein methyltransferase CheR
MDLVLCRNVLMYFTPHTVARVVAGFHEALVEDGWLLVAPSEASQCLYSQFTPIAFPEATFYRKSTVLPIPPRPAPIHSVILPHRTKPVAGKVVPSSLRRPVAEIAAPFLVAKAFADKGELAEALSWCDRAIASDPLAPAHRYLRAMVAQELGRLDEAMEFLGQALYLDADFIMAHYALGNLAERLGRREEAARHFRNALALLLGRSNEEPLPEAGGITAGRLSELIRSVGERGR